jgi:hypothetical protein
MSRKHLLVCIVALYVLQLGAQKHTSKRTIPCKTAANANECYWTRGRLRTGNGMPAYRLWKVGTNRVLGIYSGPSVDREGLDNEAPEFPRNIQTIFDSHQHPTIYADYEVCPLEKEQPGSMQAACIESAKNILVKDKSERDGWREQAIYYPIPALWIGRAIYQQLSQTQLTISSLSARSDSNDIPSPASLVFAPAIVSCQVI